MLGVCENVGEAGLSKPLRFFSDSSYSVWSWRSAMKTFLACFLVKAKVYVDSVLSFNVHSRYSCACLIQLNSQCSTWLIFMEK
jgi:hypothetical protein